MKRDIPGMYINFLTSYLQALCQLNLMRVLTISSLCQLLCPELLPLPKKLINLTCPLRPSSNSSNSGLAYLTSPAELITLLLSFYSVVYIFPIVFIILYGYWWNIQILQFLPYPQFLKEHLSTSRDLYSRDAHLPGVQTSPQSSQYRLTHNFSGLVQINKWLF